MPTKFLLLLDCFEPDDLIIDKDALAFVRLGHSPFPDRARKIAQGFAIGAGQDDLGRLWYLACDAVRYRKNDGMRISEANVETHIWTSLRGELFHLIVASDLDLLGLGRDEVAASSERLIELALSSKWVEL